MPTLGPAADATAADPAATAAWPPPGPRTGGLPSFPGYEILGEVGRGGMGVVYKARQLKLKRDVALKVILAAEHAGPEQVARFSSEAEAVARMSHPNIVQVFDVGEHSGLPYCALEFVGGGSLARKAAAGPLPAAEAARLVEQIARAVHYAHARGVVHRDLKPANVLLTPDGEPKVADFGLAKKLDEVGQTASGAVMGTPSYMSPEQAKGAKEVGPPADVYAVGAILYDLLTGRPPFREATMYETINRVIADDPVPPRRLNPSVPRDLETVALKCLAKDPRRRYHSALALAQDLERFQAGEPILARPEGALEKGSRMLRRNWVPIASAVAVLLALTVAGYVAARVSAAQRASALRHAADEALEPAEWTAESLAAADAAIDALRRAIPDEADGYRERLRERFRRHLTALLDRPRLEPEDAARIEAEMEAFAGHDPDAVPGLRLRLRERMADWQREFTLAGADIAGVGQVFAAGVQPRDGALTPADPGAKSVVALTRVACPVESRLSATAEPGDGPFGVLLNATGVRDRAAWGVGYAVVLTPAVDGTRSLQLWRGGSCLRQEAVRVPAGPVTLRISRQAERLEAQVNGLSPLVFFDTFPVPGGGSYGVLWSGGARLRRLEGWRRTRPVAASPLQRGDELFAAGQYADAQAAYEQVQAGRADAAGQEGRYKVALCLLALNRPDDAATALERVAGESGPRWPAAAACRLWLVRLERNQTEEAEAAFASLSARHRFEDVVTLLPDEERQRVFGYYSVRGAGLIRGAEAIPRLERAGRVAAFMWPTLNAARSHIQADLMRACQQAGQPERAERIAREFLREVGTMPQAERMHAVDRVLREYCWLLQSQGRAKEALEELGRWYAPRPGGADVSGQLHLERAYLHAALGDWDGVTADVADLLTPDGRVKEDYGYHTHSSYWLLVGFLKERQGDREGAKAAWRAGTFPAWRKSAMKDAATGGGHAVVNRMILAGLAEEMDAAEADAILAELWRSEADGFVGRLAGTLGPAPAAALRTMWGTPRGRGYARRFAFRELPFDAVLRVPPQLLVSEVVRQGAFGDWSPRQEQLCWDVVTDAYDRFVTGKVGTTQMFQLGLTWKGTTGFLGWASVAPTLPPEFRGPVAYVIGHRLLRLKRPADAKTFFQTALKDAPPRSPLLRLAEDELERLGGK